MEMKPRPLIEYGVARLTLPGEAASGDHFLVKDGADGDLVAVVDGIGHGEEAAAAAQVAVATLEQQPATPLDSLLRLCHERLEGTRGVVISLAAFHPSKPAMAWVGVGNVDGLLLRARPDKQLRDEALLLRRGIAGIRLPPISIRVHTISEGDTLVLATDGIRDGFRDAIGRHAPPQQIADRILAEYGTRTDDALVLAVRYLGHKP